MSRAARLAIRDTTSSTPPVSTAAQRALEGGAVVGEDQPGLDALEDARSALYSLRLQRVGRRDRRVGDADVHRGQREQPVIDAVARQDHDRPLERTACDRAAPARCAAHAVERVGVGRPCCHPPSSVALREERAVGRVLRPVLEAIGQRVRIRAERRARTACRPCRPHRGARRRRTGRSRTGRAFARAPSCSRGRSGQFGGAALVEAP